ncbi:MULTISPECIES: hypothetical protein [unclassified Staphylococcus]|uniref:hypothetical protein n=1 Tax=unclassified Staphylococcus TaxID=91994 RepID=UPI0021D16D3F|nr:MULTISPECIES: hypothetical protein [unclassified Staphylococcus]UXR69268.1 hypothetical protein MUA26_09085 [Staphylococcus sp. IVB6246]UXR71321.1 hypothetical protein MUA88_09110 [Staphylococcus sp. IVB6240]UXR73597.1 hypothetical protein MUA48_09605 [Staphylococcus sp. IVB6238]UXR75913.1 hypothetical protein MUA74_09685 [Staphylococcus sp. IVB6233]UXR80110.1 hypothetical protein MUA65_09290 [Staphylococcus sp. IVB6218]
MTKKIKTLLIVFTLIAMVSEFIAGFPFIGGWYVLALGWQPLAFNIFIYIVMVLVLIFDKQNTIRPMVLIPLAGAILNCVAVIPVIGMILHWIMLILLMFMLFILYATPTYLSNAHARVIYDDQTTRK